MKILVTGSKGFIGHHLCRQLSMAGHDVIGVDFQEGNLLIPKIAEDLIIRNRPDIVIHLAAQVGISFNEDYIGYSIDANVTMTVNVARATHKAGARLVHTSTSEVYGDVGDRVLSEDDPLDGKVTGIYALSKRWSEEAAHEYCPDRLVIIRPSMPYGIGAPVGRGRRAMDNMLWQAYHRKPIIVHRGSVRSWCWIGDTIRGYQTIIESGQSGIFNVGRDDDEHSMLWVAQQSCIIADAPFELIKEIDPPVKKIMVKRLSTDKLQRLGWKPEMNISDGMLQVYEWIKQFPWTDSYL